MNKDKNRINEKEEKTRKALQILVNMIYEIEKENEIENNV